MSASYQKVNSKGETPLSSTTAELADALIRSYAGGGINHVNGKNLPSKSAVSAITFDLLRLLFPGFWDDHPLQLSTLKQVTETLMESVLAGLQREIRKSLDYAEFGEFSSAADAQALTHKFLTALPRIRELLQTDIDAAYNGDPSALSREEVIVAYPFIEAISVQRLAHELYLNNVPLIPRIMTEWAHSRTGLDLHPGARIGSHFFIDHGTGTVVGETAEIGNHVKMYQGVGLVAKSLAAGQALRGQKRHPTLRDRVTVYAGSTIMGGDTVVGEGTTIGASVFLTSSVPPNSLVVMELTNIKIVPKTSRDSYVLDFQI